MFFGEFVILLIGIISLSFQKSCSFVDEMGIEYRVLITKAVNFFHLAFKKHFFMSFELFVNEISCFFVFQWIFVLENCPRCVYIYIYIISRRSITPQHIKYNSKSLYVVQSLYFGCKLPSSGTYK